MLVVYNNVGNINVFEGSEYQFFCWVIKVSIENKDFDYSFVDLSDAKNYINKHCSNLDLIEL